MTENNDIKQQDYEAYLARVGKESIPAYEPFLGEEEARNVLSVISSGWLSEGKFSRQFEKELAAICHRQFALVFANGTGALISGMKSYGIGPGDDVIVPALAHSADPNAIVATGANPVFADVDEATLCLSPETVDAVKTTKTKAILYISAYGNAGDLEGISKYSRDAGIKFINDCAPALFGQYKDKPIAAYGDFSMLSFFADKTITTGEGGMMLTDDPELMAEANIYKNDGRRERGHDTIERTGYNFRITEMQTAIGVAQLIQKDKIIARKLEIQRRYKELMDSIPNVRVFEFNPAGRIVPHRNIILVPSAKDLIDHLSARGIGARTLFMPMHNQPCYGREGNFPATMRLYQSGVCLPSAPSLRDDQISYVADCIRQFYS